MEIEASSSSSSSSSAASTMEVQNQGITKKRKGMVAFFVFFRNIFFFETYIFLQSMLFHPKMKVKLHSWKCRIFKRKEKVLLTIFFFETYFKTYFSTDTTASEGGSEKKRARKDVQPEGMRTPPLRVCFISHTLFFILY